MLLYKFWRETQVRFLLSVLFLMSWSGFVVLYYRRYLVGELSAGNHDLDYSRYIWTLVFGEGNSLREVFMVLAILLGMGGLLRERAHGSVGFTLALPVRRGQLVLARAAVGILEIVILSFVPAAVIPGLSAAAGLNYSPAQAFEFGILWAFCGSAVYAVSFLCSAAFQGEYTAPGAAIAILFAYMILVSIPVIDGRLLDINDAMSGHNMVYLDGSILHIAAVPWPLFPSLTCFSAMIFSFSGLLTCRQDF